jgi:hypothetical protein
MAGLLDYLRDAAQGASNSAASTVSGPVDLINMGLLSMGLPMPENPFGGSQWMRERGLTRQPENFYAGLVGESVGNVLPIVAAAKAPQIAQGLLQAGDNLRAPTPVNTATGRQSGAILARPDGSDMRLFHGTRKAFDEFDDIGAARARVSGSPGGVHWFSDNPEVATGYAMSRQTRGAAPNVRSVIADLKNPLEVDARGKWYQSIEVPAEWMKRWQPDRYKFIEAELGKGATWTVKTDDLAAMARQWGHDGIVIKNVVDPGQMRRRAPATTVGVFNTDAVKPFFGR